MAETQDDSTRAQPISLEPEHSKEESTNTFSPTAVGAAVGVPDRAQTTAAETLPAASSDVHITGTGPSGESDFIQSASPALVSPETATTPSRDVAHHDEAPAQSQSTPSANATSTATTATGSTSSGSSLQPALPPFKRFSSSSANINKKFLQTTTNASGSSGTTANQSTKGTATTAAARPQPTPQLPQSRLISTKLTTTPQATSTAGWSKPATTSLPSTGPPSPANPPAITTQRNVTPTSVPANRATAPQGGPPPTTGNSGATRNTGMSATASTPKFQAASATKAWTRASQASSTVKESAINDFPTAAEAAKGRNGSNSERSPPVEPQEDVSAAAAAAAEAQKQAMSQTADAFRGVHLDPNAHHWDEMADEDNDFLGGVIKFGDGTQYNVEQTKTPRTQTPTPVDPSNKEQESQPSQNGPVSKAERFSDDFDRNWPRSRNAPQSFPTRDAHAPSHTQPVSPDGNHGMHPSRSRGGPGDNRALFNERSNKFEPYAPSGGTAPHNHKSGDTRGPPVGFLSRDRDRDRDRERGWERTPREGPNSSGPFGRDHGRGSRMDSDGPRKWGGDLPPPTSFPRDRSRDGRPGRSRERDMGPPQMSPTYGGQGREGGRPLPPHGYPSARPPSRQLSRDRSSRASDVAHSPTSTVSVLSNVGTQPSPQSQPQQQPVVDLQEYTKSAMHDAAERAKKRRQEEEAQREQERERARQKAKALEEKMKAAEAKKEDEARSHPPENPSGEPRDNAWLRRPTSTTAPTTTPKGPAEPREPAGNRRSSFTSGPLAARQSSGSIPAVDSSPSLEAGSWRSKAPTLPSKIAATTPEVDSLNLKPGESVEVVSLDELDKFLGEVLPTDAIQPDATTSPSAQTIVLKDPAPPSRRAPRPSASDFFEDSPKSAALSISRSSTISEAAPLKSDMGPWRRPMSLTGTRRPLPPVTDEPVQNDLPPHTAMSDPSIDNPPLSSTSSVFSRRLGGPQAYTRPNGPPSPTTSKSAFREVPMSTLDDTMSRIKGALDNMQSLDAAASSSSHNQRRLSDAVGHSEFLASSILARTRSLGGPMPPPREPVRSRREPPVPMIIEEDLFDVTRRPLFPLAASQAENRITVRLPRFSRPREPVPGRQLNVFRLPPRPVRWDILSWEPPIEGMSRKTLSRDELFFPISMVEDVLVVPVVLPTPPHISAPASAPVARGLITARNLGTTINLPTGSVRSGRPSEDSILSKPQESNPADQPMLPQLDAVSRSPAPDTIASTHTVVSLPGGVAPSPAASGLKLEDAPRISNPRSTAGRSEVSFNRSMKPEDDNAAVKFTVSSELEESMDDSQTVAADNTPGSKSSDEAQTPSQSSTLLTPPPVHSNTISWAKSPLGFPVIESPSRVTADSDHLKTVWSQSAAKVSENTENSLKGIADDLSASITFSLHEIKSEDGDPPKPNGETSPPSAPGSTRPTSASRMLSHDAHRLFQQAPPAPPAAPSTPSTRPQTFSSPSAHTSSLTPPQGVPNLRSGMTPSHTTPPQPQPRFPHYPPPPPHLSPGSPAMMYAVPNAYPVSPALSHRTPPGANPGATQQPVGIWMQPGQQPNTFRPTGTASYPPHMMAYPTPPPAMSPIYQPISGPQALSKPGSHPPSGPNGGPHPIGRGRGMHPVPTSGPAGHNGPMVSPIPAHAQPVGMGAYGHGMMESAPRVGYPPQTHMISPPLMGYSPVGPQPHPVGPMYNVPHAPGHVAHGAHGPHTHNPVGRGDHIMRNGFDGSSQHHTTPPGMYTPVTPANFRPW